MGDSKHRATLRKVLLAASLVSLLSAGFYLYVLVRVNPKLIHHNDEPIFLTSTAFLTDLLTRPGGAIQYVSLFFYQFYYFPWAGALVITLTAALMVLGTNALIKAAGQTRARVAASLVPGVLLLLGYSRYEHDPAASAQIIVAIWLAVLYARLPLRSTALRVVVFAVVSGAGYYVLGGGYFLFAVLCGILELTTRRSIILGSFCLICAVGLPYGSALYSYELAEANAFAPLLPFSSVANPSLLPILEAVRTGSIDPLGRLTLAGAVQLMLVLFYPLVAIYSGTWRWRRQIASGIRRRITPAWPGRGEARDREGEVRYRPNGRIAGCSLGVVILAGVLVAGVSLDEDRKTLLTVHYAARNGMWEQVLEKVRELPPTRFNIYVMNDVNRALYHTGRLGDEMFSYPQRYDRDSIFLTFAIRLDVRPGPKELSEMFYDLGFINESEHFSHEALEQYGQSPEILKRLAKINILRFRPAAARAFIGALGKNLLHRRWAREYSRRLDRDPLLQNDEEMNYMRGLMVRDDYATGMTSKEQIGPVIVRVLEAKLQRERYNKMAFEYLMGHYLLAKQLRKMAANLHRLDDFGYPGIPRAYEEAILLHMVTYPNIELDLRGRGISKETFESFKRFAEIIELAGGDKSAVSTALMESHDGSYFLYHATGISDSRLLDLSAEPAAAVTGATK